MAEKESEHKQTVDTMKAREVELINKVEDLAQQLEVNSQELEKQNRYQLEYRKLLNEMFFEKKRNSTMSQTSVDSYRSASVIITGTSKTELTSDYGDHDTLDKELAEADSDDEQEPDQTLLVSELKAMLKDDTRLSIVDAVEHNRVVKDLRQELEDVRSAYEEDTSELQKTLMEVKTQLLSFSRQRSLSESSGSDTTQDKAESALAKIKNLQRQIAQQREDHNEVIQLLETAQTLASDRERKVNELSASLEVLRTDYSHQSSQVETLNVEITQLKSQITETQQQLQVAQQAAEEFEKKAGENAKMLESITSERDARARDASDLRAKLDKHGKHHEASVKGMQNAHKEEVQNLKKDNSEYLTIIQHLKDQVSESETSISTHLLQITSFQQKLEAAGKENDKIKRAKTIADRDLKDLRNEVALVTKQRQEARENLAEVSELLNQLQKDYESLKTRKSAENEALVKDQAELIQALEARLAELEARPSSADQAKRMRSGSMSGRWSNGIPTPPPTMPLPPLPGLPAPPLSPTSASPMGRTTPTLASRSLTRTNSQDQLLRTSSRDQLRSSEPDAALLRQLEEKDAKIAKLEKEFQSERQLVQTLEEALSDTEKSMKQLKKQTNSLAADKEMLHTRMLDVSHQLEIAKKEAAKSRDSIQQLDEARHQRAQVPTPFMFVNCRRSKQDDSWRSEWRISHIGGSQNFRAFKTNKHYLYTDRFLALGEDMFCERDLRRWKLLYINYCVGEDFDMIFRCM
jgi:DNA repair exonuclease SbcCD ATPase subunit